MIETRCFKSVLDNLLHISNEGLTFCIHIALLFCTVEIKEKASAAVVGIIAASWVVNIFFSGLKVMALIIEKIKNMRKKGVVIPDEISKEVGDCEKNKRDLNRTEAIISVIDLDGGPKELK